MTADLQFKLSFFSKMYNNYIIIIVVKWYDMPVQSSMSEQQKIWVRDSEDCMAVVPKDKTQPLSASSHCLSKRSSTAAPRRWRSLAGYDSLNYFTVGWYRLVEWFSSCTSITDDADRNCMSVCQNAQVSVLFFKNFPGPLLLNPGQHYVKISGRTHNVALGTNFHRHIDTHN